MAGPNIIVSGAAFADTLIAQTLTDNVSIIPRLGSRGRSPLDDTGYRVARLFRALRVCIEELSEFYSQLAEAMAPPPPTPSQGTGRIGGRLHSGGSAGINRSLQPAMIGPHFTKYKIGENEVVLKYTSRLASKHTMKSVFMADATSESEVTKVVVKFAHAYNKEAHELLAETSQAPKLRYCEFEPSVEMWVVVMDYVQGQEVNTMLTNPAHIASLRAAVTRLHERGLVFGDLRRPNVLVVKNRVVLIDFDWCGKVGKAKYPSDILLDGVGWHRGVQRGGLITNFSFSHKSSPLPSLALHL